MLRMAAANRSSPDDREVRGTPRVRTDSDGGGSRCKTDSELVARERKGRRERKVEKKTKKVTSKVRIIVGS